MLFKRSIYRDFSTKRKVSRLFAIFMLASTMLNACTQAAPATQVPAASEIPASANIDELISAAKAEGALNTIGVPPDNCNYGEAFDTFKKKYGLTINEINPYAGSGDQMEAIRANKDNKSILTPDVIDVGFAFGAAAKAENLLMPYKASNWNTIPNEVKDPDGYWYGGYFGVMSFLVNTDIQPKVPRDWNDLLSPAYKEQVALTGDPRSSSGAIQAVYAAGLAEGPSLDNPKAGLDFFAKLNKAGNLVPTVSTNSLVASGETPVRIGWDYVQLSAIDLFAGNPKTELVIPQSGSIAGVYVQAISAYAPHPNAAKLWIEFLSSDEGQLIWMKGYCHPIREADLRSRGVIPADLLARWPDVSNAVFPTPDQLRVATQMITENWDSVVGTDIQKAP